MGLGLRGAFIHQVRARLDAGSLNIPFFEVTPETFMRRGGALPEALAAIRAHRPLMSHGLALSVGSTTAFDAEYLTELRDFLQRFAIPQHSDHLCFCGVDGVMLHDLLPLPQTRAAAAHTAARIAAASERLGVPMLIENISRYVVPGPRELPEAEFIRQVIESADCGLLLDVNNVYVNACNDGTAPLDFLRQLPLDRVAAIHVAGYEHAEGLLAEGLLIDTHGAAVTDPVLELLEWVLARTGPVPVVLERDNHVPQLDQLLEELQRIEQVYARGIARWQASHDRAP